MDCWEGVAGIKDDEIKELKEDCLKLTKEMKKLKHEFGVKLEEVDHLKHEREEVSIENQELIVKVGFLERKACEKERELEEEGKRREEEISNLKSENLDLEKKLAKVKIEVEGKVQEDKVDEQDKLTVQFQQNLEMKVQEIDERNKKIKKLEEWISGQQTKINVREKEVSNLRISWKMLEEEKEKKLKKYKALVKSTKQENQRNIEEHKVKINGMKEQLQRVNAELTKLENELKLNSFKIKECKQEIKVKDTKLMELRDRDAEHREEVVWMRKEMKEVALGKREAEVKLVELGSKLEVTMKAGEDLKLKQHQQIVRLTEEKEKSFSQIKLMKQELGENVKKLNSSETKVEYQSKELEKMKKNIETVKEQFVEGRKELKRQETKHQDEVNQLKLKLSLMSKVENDFKLKVEQDKKIALNFKMKEKEITRLQQECVEQRTQVETLELKLKQQDTDLESLAKLEEENERSKNEIKNLRLIVTSLNNESLETKRENERLKGNVEEVSTKLSSATKVNATLVEKISRLEDRVVTLRKSLASLKKADAESAEKKVELDEMEAKIKKMEEDYIGSQGKLKMEIIHLMEQVRVKETNIQRLQQEIGKLTQKREKGKKTKITVTSSENYEEEIVTSDDDCDVIVPQTRFEVGIQTQDVGQHDQVGSGEIKRLEELLGKERELTKHLRIRITNLENQPCVGEVGKPGSEEWRSKSLKYEVEAKKMERTISSLNALLEVKETETIQLKENQKKLQKQIQELQTGSTPHPDTCEAEQPDLAAVKDQLERLEAKLDSRSEVDTTEVHRINFANIKVEFENITLRREVSVLRKVQEVVEVGTTTCHRCSLMEEDNEKLHRDIERLKLELGHFEKYFFDEVEDLKFNYKQAVKTSLLYEGQLKSISHKYHIKVDVLTHNDVERL
uniref:golgin subfamily A member 6-like protein 22 isoform X3 n=1 Tax=Ciona intestinalis TaxID=7719 RepID=UPI000EF4D07E|nr:golgin subfamily A member 6-like protein 22 isoform X3 [Ciona intestinalis]|eukprot:XP_026695710.1 golgin subfamily A member 6-like protein 22 isoform X3 [Ciona intestinalis]